MKKVLLVFVSIIAILSSCSKTNEDKVKASFINYAETHLDDPSSLEVVSIEIIDTIDMVKTLIDASNMHDSLSKAKDLACDSLMFNVNKYGSRLNNLPGFRTKWVEYMDLLEGDKNRLLGNAAVFLSTPDSYTSPDKIKDEDGMKLIASKVKYRTKENGSLKLKELEAYSSLNLEKIEYTGLDDVPEKYKKILRTLDFYNLDNEANIKVMKSAVDIIILIKSKYENY